MQWLCDIKKQYNDPVDLVRLHIIPKDLGLTASHYRWTTDDPSVLNCKSEQIKNSLRKIVYLKSLLPRLIRYLPFIEFIGISGSVSSLGALPNDDIDLFIITAPKRLALARLNDWLVMNLFKVRRNKNTPQGLLNNTLCCNYYISADQLDITPHNSKNALELAELIPVYDRQNGWWYYQLLLNNSWLHDWLPDWYSTTRQDMANGAPATTRRLPPKLISLPLDVLEMLVGLAQQCKIKAQQPRHKFRLFIKRLMFWPGAESN